jgi:hypothetical protein
MSKALSLILENGKDVYYAFQPMHGNVFSFIFLCSIVGDHLKKDLVSITRSLHKIVEIVKNCP